MKLSNLFLNNKPIFKKALESSIIAKVATDSAQAGGVMLEMNVEEASNEVLAVANSDLIIMTNMGVIRHIRRGFDFDFSSVGATDYQDFRSLIKTSDSIVSSADIYLFKKVENTFILMDAESFKTSTSDSSNMIYLHNDADGSIFNGLSKTKQPDFGQVLMLDFSPSSGVCRIYLAEGSMSKFTELFSEPTLKEGEVVYHGKNLINKKDMTTASGSGRTLLKLINRAKKKTKKDSDEALASTSFSRGIQIDKGFLPILKSRGLIEEIHSFTIDFKAIEEEDFKRRYPQTI